MTGRRYTLEGVTVNGQFVAGDIRGDLHLNQSGTQDRPVAQRRDDFEDAAVRLGFGCDVVGFSGRSGPERRWILQQLPGTIERVIRAVGVEPAEALIQTSGDGAYVFLPQPTDPRRATTELVSAFGRVLEERPDHPSLRVALVQGLVASVPHVPGWDGLSIVTLHRILNAPEIRTSAQHARLTLALTVDLMRDTVDDGFPVAGVGREEFRHGWVEDVSFWWCSVPVAG